MNPKNNIFFNNNNNILKKHIFFFIAQKIIDNEQITKEINIKKAIMYNFILKNEYSIKNKFDLITETSKNVFYNLIVLDAFLSFLCKIQKVYFALIKFKNIYKYKKTKIQVDYDMCLNQIDTTKKNCICIYQNNKLYWFLIRDLINIINTSLINAPGFFSEPLVSKNPYNNIPFNKSTLYNIYFRIKYSGIKMPELINNFFLTNFDLGKFTYDYEYLIREYVIENYIKNTSEINLYQAVIIMLKKYNELVKSKYKIIVDTEFPKERLVNILKPCLLLYFKYRYSLIELVKQNSVYEFKKNLILLKKNNPGFGRKIYKNNKSNNSSSNFYYSDSHINFYNNTTNNFLNSHTNNDYNNDYEFNNITDYEEDYINTTLYINENVIIPINNDDDDESSDEDADSVS